MTRNFALAAIAAAALAASPMVSTGASAKDGRRTNAAIGIAAGIGGALLGAAIINAQQPRYHVQQRFVGERGYHNRPRHYDNGFQTVGSYEAEEECFEKPVRRIDAYTGRVITVGTKLVCR
ncbi:MAG: hypothetical protein ACRC56_07590 [Bosea sp. (in: a-proteobacteria)]